MSAHYWALVLAIAGGVCGQLLLKQGAVDAVELKAQLFRLPTLAGLSFYGVSAIAYVYALQRVPLSVAFPSVALSYVVIALLGAALWSEPLHAWKLAGIGLICLGVTLLYRS